MRMENMTVNGRDHVCGDVLWMASSACTAGFLARDAKYCRVLLRGDCTATDENRETDRARVEIRVDGKRVWQDRIVSPEVTVTAFESNRAETHEVKIIKLSECTSSLVGIADIVTDGQTEKLPEQGEKLLVIGDSITCGYGVEGDLTQIFTTATENATAAYGYLAAEELGMDFQLFSFSGFGIISGYTDDGKINEECLVPPIYEYCGKNSFVLPDGRTMQEIPWDRARFRPDWIILNLGTNDLSYCREDPEKKAAFGKAYAKFLKTIRESAPQARILCVLGIMGTGLNDEMVGAVRKYCEETGDMRMRALPVEEQDQETDGVGTDYHPSTATQKKLALKVADAIRQWKTEG